MKERKAPGELELLILKELQKLKKATVSDIVASLKDQYAYTTVMTVLARMYKKNAVGRKKIGKQFQYYLNEKKQSHSILTRVKKALFKNDTAAMIHYLLETSDNISSDELTKIEKLIKKHKK